MKTTSLLQTLYQSISALLAGRTTPLLLDTQETPVTESVSQRQYFVSHIDDYCDCV